MGAVSNQLADTAERVAATLPNSDFSFIFIMQKLSAQHRTNDDSRSEQNSTPKGLERAMARLLFFGGSIDQSAVAEWIGARLASA
jgi:hypothetical protein